MKCDRRQSRAISKSELTPELTRVAIKPRKLLMKFGDPRLSKPSGHFIGARKHENKP